MTYSTGVLLVAIRCGYRYGFDIMDVTGLPDGTVYPALRRMEKSGLLTSSWEGEESARREQRPARRYYELTEAGAEAVQEAIERFPGLSRLFPETELDSRSA